MQVSWHPFMLDPSLPAPGTNKMALYRKKFGARFDAMIPHMKQVGSTIGVNFSYGGNVGNTLNSHRLVTWAQKQGADAEDKMINCLFSAYFENERDISDVTELVKISSEAGFDADAIRAFLATDDLKAEVISEIQSWQQKVNGVPFFVIDGKHEFSGAQDTSFLLSVFKRIGVPLKNNL